MTAPDPAFTLLPAEEVVAAAREDLTVTLTLAGRDSAVVGRLLDLIGHAARLGGIECAVQAPGYYLSFYGWEKKAE